MQPLVLHEFHHALQARFGELNGREMVAHYGDAPAEHAALRQSAGVLDLSFRSRLCLTGADRVRFLHGQVTNDVNALNTGEGCYAALVTAKGRMQSDLNIFRLDNEVLLDFEPGLAATVTQRLENFIVADDVQVVDVAAHYGLLSVQGPAASRVSATTELFAALPEKPLQLVSVVDPTLGEIYLANQPRFGSTGFDWFVPTNALGAVADKLIAAAKIAGGRACGWDAFDTCRIEAGIPRFGVDMDETHIPLECGIEGRAVSYRKGCYIGQEVINRIHTIGHVTRELRGLLLPPDLETLPSRGEKLTRDGKEVGFVTSAVRSPSLRRIIALGYVRREAAPVGTELRCGIAVAVVTPLPFVEPAHPEPIVNNH